MSESYIALYRKYRPQSFKDVAGQDKIVDLLESTIKQKKISHAYLFCGGRGTGKTTVARIFANEIGCSPEDIIEIDAASNRGIDEIRELREAVRTVPFSSSHKVYIIDEAHMLTKEAANALLKTLEEPPAHVIFILATTDPEKLPTTIISRCQKIIFVSPDVTTLSKQLVYVAKKEGKVLEDATAALIAVHGNGSYRDALGVLEQVLSFGDTTISHDQVLAFLGVTDKEKLMLLFRSICTKDMTLLVTTCLELESSQASSLKAYDDVVEMFRLGLLSRVTTKKEIPVDIVTLAKENPYSISSKTILNLLSNRHLLQVSSLSSWAAFQAVMIGLLEEK